MSQTALDPTTENQDPQSPSTSDPQTTSHSQAQEKTFLDFFSPEVREDPSFEKFKAKSGDDLFNSYKNLEKTLGSRVKLPDANSTEADIESFWTKLGRPATKDDYAIEFDSNLNLDDASKDGFKEVFHKANMTQDQATFVMQALNQGAQVSASQMMEQSDRSLIETETALKREWGANTDMNKALAKRAISAVFGDQAAESIIRNNGNNYDFVVGMKRVGSMLSEKGLLGKTSPRELGGYSPAEARQQYAAIINDKNNAEYEAYHTKKHPQHQQVVDKVLGLISASQQEG